MFKLSAINYYKQNLFKSLVSLWRTLSQGRGQGQGLGTEDEDNALCPRGALRTRTSPRGHITAIKSEVYMYSRFHTASAIDTSTDAASCRHACWQII